MERKFYILIAPLIPLYNAKLFRRKSALRYSFDSFTAIQKLPSEKGFL